MERSRSRFISIWIVVTLVLLTLLALALFSFQLSEAAGSDMDAVEALVDRMQAAVLAGHREGYAALGLTFGQLDGSFRVWLTESAPATAS